MLTGLRSYKNEHTILPKYHYPSAGSLYPVQVYIEHYYYNPSMHTLTAIDNRQDHISLHSFIDLQLHFVSALEAITPLYEEYSMAFCELEVGYMIALIAARAKQLGYRITPLINPTQTHDLNLSPHDHYHITVKFSSTKTIKENPFVFAPHVAIKILIYIKPHAVDQLSAGLYQWRDNQLLYQENWQPQNENFDQLGANGAILSDAQCIIFFLEQRMPRLIISLANIHNA